MDGALCVGRMAGGYQKILVFVCGFSLCGDQFLFGYC